MEELVLQQPKLIGREKELNRLTQSLNDALAGKGSTIFVTGEAGIGKTRLVSELLKDAEEKACRIIHGRCLAENLEPLMPVRTALRDAGLMHLISGDPPPLLVSIYLVDDSGILIAGSESRDMSLDSHIFSSMLKAVGDFVKDSMRMVDGTERTGGLNTLGYGDFKIIMEEHHGLHLACVTMGGFSEQLVTDMKDVLREIAAEFGDVLANWNGDTDMVCGVKGSLSVLMDSGKYRGRFLVDDPKLKQENLFDNVLLGLQRASADRPLMIFLDDLQWSDPTSLNLLHYLARNIKTSNILMLGAYRPEDISQSDYGKVHPLKTTMQYMSQEDSLEIMKLERLDLNCTEGVMCSALCDSLIDKDFLEKVYAETGGTPLFILEFLKLLAYEGAIARDTAGKRALIGELETLDLPKKIYDMIKRRLDRLTREQREMLEWAAVIGEEFSADILERNTEMNRVAILRCLADIENTHRLVHSSRKSYRFDHAKVREVVYNGIMEELRGEYHRMVADTLIELYGEGEVINELAYHYLRASDPRAGKYLVVAGDLAREKYYNHEAIISYRNALDFLSGQEMMSTMEILADLFALTGDYNEATKLYEKALDAADDGRTKARMLRKIGEMFLNKGDFDSCLETLCRAKELVGEADGESGRLLFEEGRAYQRKGDNDRGLATLQMALVILEKSGEKKDIGDVLRALGAIHWNKGNFDIAMSNYSRSLEIMEEIKDENGMAAALGNMGIVSHNRGDLDNALKCYERSLLITEKIGNKAATGAILANIGLAYWDKGELEISLDYQIRSLRILEKIGNQKGIAGVLGNIGLIQRDNGDLDSSLAYQRKSLEIGEKIGDRAGTALALVNLGEVLWELGDLDGAMAHYTKSLDICRRIGDKLVSILNLCGMAEVCLAHGDTSSATSHSEKALEISAEIGAKSEEAMSRRVLGSIYRAECRNEAATAEFEKAMPIVREIGDRKGMARLHYEMALLHEAEKDLVGTRTCMETALSEYERMGMKLWAEKCRKALAEPE